MHPGVRKGLITAVLILSTAVIFPASAPAATQQELAKARAERASVQKELDRTAKDIAAIDARLGNEGFLAKAPDDVVEEARDRRVELESRKGRIAQALTRLQAAE